MLAASSVLAGLVGMIVFAIRMTNKDLLEGLEEYHRQRILGLKRNLIGHVYFTFVALAILVVSFPFAERSIHETGPESPAWWMYPLAIIFLVAIREISALFWTCIRISFEISGELSSYRSRPW